MRKRYRNLLVSLFALLLASGCASVSAQSKNENPFFVFEQSRKLLREHAEQLKRQTNATPDNLDTQLNLGRTLFLLALEQDDEARQQAETFFNKLLEQNPDNAVALAYRGSLLGLKIGSQAVPENETVQLGQQSLFDLDRAVKLSPDSIEVRQIRGYANFFMPASAGRESIAIEDFNHLIALLAQSPDTKHQRAKIYLILGDVHRKRNDQSNARANWQRAIEIAPETATAETAKSRLSNQEKQKETDETNLIDLVAFFGFSIGTLLFGLLTVLITRDVIRLRRRRAMFLSLTVSGILLIWNAASLTFVIAQALGNEKAKPLIAWTQNPFLLALAFAPIPFGLLAAWRLYKATFMDIVIKRGAAVLAILVFAFLYTQLIEAQLFWTLLRVSNPTLRSFFFASVWVGFLLSFPTLRNWIYLMIDRHLFKRRDYARVLDKFNEKLRSVTDEQSLLATSEDYLQKAFYAESVRFVEASDELKAKLSTAADIVLRQQVKDESLETEFAKHRAELLLIIREPEGASGFFLFGQRAYGQGYLSEELSVLRAVARQISQAIENLRLHEAKRQHAIAEEELRKLVSQAELKALRAQIDPHFFFNSLNSVAALIHRAPRRAEELLEDLSDLFRHSFKERKDFIALSEEVYLVNIYMKVEQIRLGEKLSFHNAVDADALPIKIPALCIQPLIENAVKHGLGNSAGGGSVTLSATFAGGHLHISVSDTGIGISPTVLSNIFSQGVGLRNVNERLQRIYGEKVRLQIDSSAMRGTTVSFTIPLAGQAVHKTIQVRETYAEQ